MSTHFTITWLAPVLLGQCSSPQVAAASSPPAGSVPPSAATPSAALPSAGSLSVAAFVTSLSVASPSAASPSAAAAGVSPASPASRSSAQTPVASPSGAVPAVTPSTARPPSASPPSASVSAPSSAESPSSAGSTSTAVSPVPVSVSPAAPAQPPPGATSPFGGDVRLSRAYLLGVAEPPAPALSRFVGEVGPVEAAERVLAGDVPADVRDETSSRALKNFAERDLAMAKSVGARLVIPEDEDWPAWPLLALDVAGARGLRWAGQPTGLWVQGNLSLTEATESAVALVGARSATGYGEYVAAEFGHGIAAAGVTVVSGAAYGIDGAAHRGSLAAGGPTVAVLGCGVDMPYPAGHTTLLRSIAENGAVVSEYAPNSRPARHRFLVRNRLIAALAAGTVVVEAGRRSGARNTAAAAKALGKVVMAVPGPITSAMSVGCHELLREGDAIVASSAADVLESVGTVGTGLAERPPAEARRTDGLDEQSLRVHEALERDIGSSPERIATVSGLPLERVRAVLPRLELGGLVERCESGWRLVPEGDHLGKECGDA